MARAQKKFHYIYKTTCNITNRYYIGMHSTTNLNDGYMGSGKRLRHSIRKYGVENHTKEILEFLDDRDSLAKRENEIVNEGLIHDPLCMNLKTGGHGGFISKEQQLRRSKAAGKASALKLKTDPVWKEKHAKVVSSNLKKAHESGKIKYDTFKGKSHTDETKKLMSEKAKLRTGVKNSQFGSRWITNGIENKKINKEDQIPKGWYLGRRIHVR